MKVRDIGDAWTMCAVEDGDVFIVTRSVRGMFVRTVRRDQEKGDRSISDVWWRIVCAYLVQNKHNYIGV